MSSQSAVELGSRPSLRVEPEGRSHPFADDAVDVAGVAGLLLDEWQESELRGSVRMAGDVWAAREVVEIVGRQNGKGSILEARQLAGLFVFNERLQLHSAHEFKTCYEHFRRVKNLVEDCPILASEVAIIRTGAGDQSIELKNGNRIRFIARSRSSGRGFSADVVYLDEAFELSDETVGALMPAMSARPNPQIWYTSSAPHETSTVLHRLRKRALEGDNVRLWFSEWGNSADVDPLDRDAWYRANPALGIRISEDDVAAEQRSMSPAEFARERLGIADVPLADQKPGPIDGDRWRDLTDGESMAADESVRLSLDAPPDRTCATFAVAGKRADGLTHVAIRHDVPPHEMSRLVELAKTLVEMHATPIILPPNSPAKAWKADLVAAGVPLDELSPAEYAEACGAIQAKVLDGAMRHRGQPAMDAAVAGLAVRATGDVETWSRRSSSANIAPFVAATCALLRVPEQSGFDGDWFVDLDGFLEDDD